MKTSKLFLIVLIASFAMSGFQVGTDSENLPKFKVMQISSSKWNTPDGIPYRHGPGANLGVTSFQIIDENKIAYLCDATSEIIITDKSNGKAIKKFNVAFAPRDLVYDKGSFYVLDESKVTVYDTNGKETKKITFPNHYGGVERLTRYNNATYLLLPNSKSLKLEPENATISSKESEGIITVQGYSISTQRNGNSYSVKLVQPDGTSNENIYSTDKKLGGVYVIGATHNSVLLDVQIDISEHHKIAVERYIVAISVKDGKLGGIISTIRFPDCYYVFANRDIDVTATGKIYNMITAPQGIFIFELAETKSKTAQGYPSTITQTKYNANEHLEGGDAEEK